MDARVMIEPQEGASYEQQLRIAQAAERLGFEGLFRADHLMRLDQGSGLPGPTDAWITLAGLARESRILRLGTLVSPATFRQPGPLALMVAQVDAMSGGRVELGLGAGWHEGEHLAWGLPFPPRSERMARLEEQLEILTGIWSGPAEGSFDYEGRYYSLRGCPALPRPVQAPLPLIIGGTGPRRTPRLAARFAAECNVPFVPPDKVAAQFERVGAACEEVGRDPATLVRSVAVTVCCAEDERDLFRRLAATGESEAALRERRSAVGRPEEVAQVLAEFATTGASRVYLQVLDLDDLEHLELLAAEVLPHLG